MTDLSQAHFSEEVVFYDTDSGGVVSNIAYLRYVEKARCLLFSQLGYPLGEMTETGVYPTVVRTEIDYRKPARLGDRLKIQAKLESVNKIRMHCSFVIQLSSDQDQIVVEAKQTVVLVKMPEGKPVKPPKDWIKS